MIIVLFGQPASGKTTLAKAVQTELFIKEMASYPVIDGDEIREIFKNKDYSREGRIRNLNRISDIATFLAHQYKVVIVSAVYPYNEAREYLESIYKDVIWIYLKHTDQRGRENFHVQDFELPIQKQNILPINTTKDDIEFATQKICSFYRQISNLTRRA
jgi:adenylylsulfate kinase-like enzyme